MHTYVHTYIYAYMHIYARRSWWQSGGHVLANAPPSKPRFRGACVGGWVWMCVYRETHSLLWLFTTVLYYRLELSSAAAQNTSNHVIILKSFFWSAIDGKCPRVLTFHSFWQVHLALFSDVRARLMSELSYSIPDRYLFEDTLYMRTYSDERVLICYPRQVSIYMHVMWMCHIWNIDESHIYVDIDNHLFWSPFFLSFLAHFYILDSNVTFFFKLLSHCCPFLQHAQSLIKDIDRRFFNLHFWFPVFSWHFFSLDSNVLMSLVKDIDRHLANFGGNE